MIFGHKISFSYLNTFHEDITVNIIDIHKKILYIYTHILLYNIFISLYSNICIFFWREYCFIIVIKWRDFWNIYSEIWFLVYKNTWGMYERMVRGWSCIIWLKLFFQIKRLCISLYITFQFMHLWTPFPVITNTITNA